ncbi:hypothetical protein [Alkalibacillus haloalkaliphilus]|uniref:Helix-turn-helix conjugative transposon-like domain-containing protein n=1 Tax=Alkalibacillus haloalkaliphilus TaxID=94136 RepID=A0A511W843_9BACI|nr:hypothetical protein [Alkalibacillus haloalkaliphilus]GEN47196.1 hypothetical protein AHA02nite_29720 [Alkalibacillus haloalkaliphilus]
MHNLDENEIIQETLMMMKPKIKKSVMKTNYQERDDLEQEINLKVVQAVKNKRIIPVDFWEFVEKNIE